MAHKLILNPHIPGDLVEALDYYAPMSLELANRFRQRVKNRLDDVAERPESFPFDIPPIRFARIERFP